MKLTAALCLFPVVTVAWAQSPGTVTAGEIIERIRQQTGVPWSQKTVDTVKTGDPETRVTGVATTFLATLDVLERATARGLNLIVTHEPTFYNHHDETEWFESDPVYKAKREFIERHGLVVFRFHDHWHRRNPDGIDEGMTAKLGWKQYRQPEQALVFEIPKTTVRQLARYIETRFDRSTLRIVGDPAMTVTRVGMSPGASGTRAHIRLLRRDDVEVVLAGESQEWETVEYVRDASDAGYRKAFILLGHVNSEEAGMENCASWIEGFVPEVPVEFVPAGDPFSQP